MILGKKKANAAEDKNAADINQLMECMQKYIDGDFAAIDVSAFNNTELAEKYNAMLDAAMDRNNRMLVRLNDAMDRIGDSELVKNMLEEVDSQTVFIENMRDSSKDLGSSIENIQSSAFNIQESSHSIIDSSRNCAEKMNESLRLVDGSTKLIAVISDEMVNFRDKARKINEIIDQVRNLAEDSSLLGLNASIEAARVGEAGRGFAVVAEQVNQLSRNTSDCAEDVVKYVGELMDGIDELVESVKETTASLDKGNQSVHESISVIHSMNNQLEDINTDIDKINDEINNQSEVTDHFLEDIQQIADSYQSLSKECLATGARFYRISRDIDGARGDMFRKNSRPTLHDTISVYEIDHLIFAWRIYNHLAGYEKLKLEQLNNPTKCKVGIWFGKQTDPMITQSEGYKQAFSYHDELHRCAVESWTAAESGDRELALKHFYAGLDAFKGYREGLEKLRETLRQNGITEETPVWVFQPM